MLASFGVVYILITSHVPVRYNKNLYLYQNFSMQCILTMSQAYYLLKCADLVRGVVETVVGGGTGC